MSDSEDDSLVVVHEEEEEKEMEQVNIAPEVEQDRICTSKKFVNNPIFWRVVFFITQVILKNDENIILFAHLMNHIKYLASWTFNMIIFYYQLL